MTIEEQHNAIIEDAKAAGFSMLTNHMIGNVQDNILKKLTKFAQLQAARNQSNNVPVGVVSQNESWQEYYVDWTDRTPPPLGTKLYTSPQQSNALEMARNHRDTLISIRQCFADSAIGKKSARLQINNARDIINKALSALITQPESTSPQQSTALEMAANDRKLQAYPTIAAFFDKYAIGSKVKTSCFTCGSNEHQPSIKHLELPNIYVCEKCSSLLTQPESDGK